MKHIDSTRGLGSKFKSAMTNLWVDSFGATAIPMVQSYDMQHYANARKIIKDGINASVDFLNQPGNVLFVTPEGTRIRDRKLGQGERGLELILRKTKDQNVLILPLAAIHDRVIPIATDTLVSAGKPFTYPEILTEQQRANGG